MELDRVRRLEAAALRGWPATVQRLTPGGWVLRATPGLDRARSNHALSPCRALDRAELAPAIAVVEAFAREHRIRAGIQVSPLAQHGALQDELDARGWGSDPDTLVLTGPAAVSAPVSPELVISDRADAGWLAAWSRCDPGRDVERHAATVLDRLQQRGRFARIGSAGVAIGVPWDSTLGIYCMAVEPGRRRNGVGRGLLAALLRDAPPGTSLAHLQVESGNTAARAFYARLGFAEAYRYRHRRAPR